MICKKLTNTTNKLGRVWTFGLALFCGCGVPASLHCCCFYFFADAGSRSIVFLSIWNLESLNHWNPMQHWLLWISFVAQWFSPWLGAVCPIPFLFLQCFARTAKKFSAKSFGRLLNGLHVSQLWETLTDASVAMWCRRPTSWGLWSPLNGVCGISQNQPFNPTSMPLRSRFMKCLLQTRNVFMMVTTLILLSPNAGKKLQGESLWLRPLDFAMSCMWVIWTQQPNCWSKRNSMLSRWTTCATSKSETSWSWPTTWNCTGQFQFQQDLGHFLMFGEDIHNEDFEVWRKRPKFQLQPEDLAERIGLQWW